MIMTTITSYRPAFAWLPTRMDCGAWIWLRTYQAINGGKRKRLFDAPKKGA